MNQLLIIYDIDGWAYHFRALALARHAPPDFQVRIGAYDLAEERAMFGEDSYHQRIGGRLELLLGNSPPDIVLVLCQTVLERVRRMIHDRGWPTLIVVSWNNGWPRLHAQMNATLAHADAMIINNRDYWERAGRIEGTYPISNGIDLEIFRPFQSAAERQPRVLWCGSTYHRILKGYDIILPLFKKLEAEGIACEAKLVDPRSNERLGRSEMVEWYNSGTILVCASESEGTPNTALEAAACGCTVVTTRVGNMLELIIDGVNGIFVDRDLENVHHGIHKALNDNVRLATNLHHDIQSWDWKRRAPEFFSLFRELLNGLPVASAFSSTPPASTEFPDLSAMLTVFVSTVGAASFSDCLAHLAAQDCRFRLEVIEGVSPMSAAFQQMLDRCKTPFYVQIDEDMILRPGSIRMLYQRMMTAAPEVAFVIGWLWDIHLNRAIQGVKIFRHSIAVRYPFFDVESCEKDQRARMEADGYRCLYPPEEIGAANDEGVFGLHGAHYNSLTIFERYSTLERKRLRHPVKLGWFADHAPDFMRRFQADPSELNFMALMGVITGRLTGGVEAGEKDFNRYDRLVGFAEALMFKEACLQAVKDGRSEEP